MGIDELTVRFFIGFASAFAITVIMLIAFFRKK